MKIIRKGKIFELTFAELRQAHEEFEIMCNIEDAEFYITNNNIVGGIDNETQNKFKTFPKKIRDKILKKAAIDFFDNPSYSYTDARRDDIINYMKYYIHVASLGRINI